MVSVNKAQEKNAMLKTTHIKCEIMTLMSSRRRRCATVLGAQRRERAPYLASCELPSI